MQINKNTAKLAGDLPFSIHSFSSFILVGMCLSLFFKTLRGIVNHSCPRAVAGRANTYCYCFIAQAWMDYEKSTSADSTHDGQFKKKAKMLPCQYPPLT